MSFIIFGSGSYRDAARLESETAIINTVNVTSLFAYSIVGPIDTPANPYSIGKVALINASFNVFTLCLACLGGRVKPTVSSASGN